MNFLALKQSSLRALFAIALLMAFSALLISEEWLTGRGDSGQTGASSKSFSGKPEKKWAFRAEEEFNCVPAVTETKVFIGGEDGGLYCLDRTTGRLLWSFAMEGGIEAAPCVAGAIVIAADLLGNVRGLSLESGKELWRFKTGKRITGGAVPDASGQVWFGSYDDTIYSLVALSGKLAFSLKTKSYINGSPAIYTLASKKKTLAIFGSCDQKIRAIDSATGKIAWEIETDSYIAGTVLIQGKIGIALAYEGQGICFDPESGKTLWQADLTWIDGTLPGSPTARNGRILLVGSDGTIACLDIANGKKLWSSSAESQTVASPVIAGDAVLVASGSGELRAFSLDSGKYLWVLNIGGKLMASPAICDGQAFIGTPDGRVLCYE